jgi:hypothetical protein
MAQQGTFTRYDRIVLDSADPCMNAAEAKIKDEMDSGQYSKLCV